MNTYQSPSLDVTPPPWYDEFQASVTTDERIPVRQTIRRDNRLSKSLVLPIIAVSNLRCLILKIRNFAQDILEREVGLALLTEVWQKKDKKKHMKTHSYKQVDFRCEERDFLGATPFTMEVHLGKSHSALEYM